MRIGTADATDLAGDLGDLHLGYAKTGALSAAGHMQHWAKGPASVA